MSEELLKPMQIAERWGVSRSWVYGAAEEGRIPHLRLGGARGPLRFSPVKGHQESPLVAS